MAIRAEVILQFVAGCVILFCLLGQVVYLLRLQSNHVLKVTKREQAIRVKTRWIFIHYHKSGHDIAKSLQTIFVGAGCANSSSHVPKRVDILPYIQQFADSDITVLSAPDLQFSWAKMKAYTNNITKIIHFVRDPVEMVLSGFLYHMQSPPPQSEHWLLQDLDICQPNPSNSRYNHIISAYTHTNESTLGGQMKSILELCRELQRRYHGHSVYQTMRNAVEHGTIDSKYDGIRLEAARSLISAHYGDLLRMTANAVFESKFAPGLTYRVFTSELPVGEIEIFTNTMSNLLEFLMNDSVSLPRNHVHQPFWLDCLNKSSALQQSVENIYIPPSLSAVHGDQHRPSAEVQSRPDKSHEAKSPDKHSEAVHITQGLMGSTLREYCKHRLLQDQVLGPVLHTLRSVLYSTGHKQAP